MPPQTVADCKKLLEKMEQMARTGSLLVPQERRQALAMVETAKKEMSLAADVPLKVGLVGGTGVGKSSCINALAGRQVSSASDRRPHTDRVVVYHHLDADPGLSLSPDLATFQPHEAVEARHLVLCDLPDIDSLVDRHRETARAVADHLDLLVFLTTPEKYADRALFSAMEILDRSRENFVFAVNKADLVTPDQLHTVKGHFHTLLSERLGVRVRLFAFSLADVAGGKDTKAAMGFDIFSKWIFRKREAKELLAIRTANAFERSGRWMEKLQQALASRPSPERLCRELEGSGGQWEAMAKVAENELLEAVFPDFVRKTSEAWTQSLPLLWPVRMMLPLARWGSLPGPKKQAPVKPVGLTTLCQTADRSLEAAAADQPACPKPPKLEEVVSSFTQNARVDEALFAISPGAGSRVAFYLFQWAILAVPVLFFLLAMSGMNSWAAEPGWGALLHGFANVPLSLFTSKGLAALAVLAILEAGVSLRLAASRENRAIAVASRLAKARQKDLARAFMSRVSESLAPILNWCENARREYGQLHEKYEEGGRVNSKTPETPEG